MEELDTHNWKEFKVEDVFGKSKLGKYHNPRDLRKDDNGYYYICASNMNNGVNSQMPRVNGDSLVLTPSKIIAWGKQCPIFTYHDEQCVTSQGMYYIDMSDYDENVALFICTALTVACKGKYSYSHCLIGSVMDKVVIKLPVKDSGDVDFEYMQNIVKKFKQESVKELEQERVKELDAYLKVTGLNDYELTEEDRELLRISGLGEYKGSDVKTYKNFVLYKLFASSNGDVDLQKKDINGVGDWVVSSGVENRGFIGKTDAKAKTFNGNTITIDMFGNAFYRKDKYKMVTHARVFSLSPLFKELDELNAQFIVASLKSLKTIYSYSNMCSWNKIKNTTISLPIKTDDSKAPIIDSSRKYSADGYIPDWEFMSRYIKAIEKEVIADAVKKKDEIIEKTKEIVNKD